MTAGRTLVYLAVAALLFAAVAAPVHAEPPEGAGDRGKGKGQGSDNAGGNASGGSSDSSSAGGSDPSDAGSSGDRGGGAPDSPGVSNDQDQGSDHASSKASEAGPAEPADHAADVSGRAEASASHPKEEPILGPSTYEESSGTDGSDSPTPLFFGVLQDNAESSGASVDFIESRRDVADLFSTDMDSPAVSIGMVVLTIGTLLGLFGAVRTEGGALVSNLVPRRRDEDAKAMESAAVAAGLPTEKWSGLESASYRKLLQMDPQTVAFWMGSDMASVLRWQAGRTLQDDIQDGIAVPMKDATEWTVPSRRRMVVDQGVSDAVPTEA